MKTAAQAVIIGGGVVGASAIAPLTWNPPMMTSKPSARNPLARSCARGNWFV